MVACEQRAGRRARAGLAAIVAGGFALAGAGCSNGVEGAFSGAALGALGGLGIGSVFGEAGAGAAIGAISGGLAGAVIGDQNERADRRALYSSGGYSSGGHSHGGYREVHVYHRPCARSHYRYEYRSGWDCD